MKKNEVTVKELGIAVKDAGGNIDSLLKPLKREILLFDGNLSGTYKLTDKKALLALKVGDRLIFKYHQSKYNPSEVEVHSELGLIGYVPECDEVVFSRLLDAGKSLIGKVKKLDFSRSFPLVTFEIYLEDF